MKKKISKTKRKILEVWNNKNEMDGETTKGILG